MVKLKNRHIGDWCKDKSLLDDVAYDNYLEYMKLIADDNLTDLLSVTQKTFIFHRDVEFTTCYVEAKILIRKYKLNGLVKRITQKQKS